MLSPLSEGHLSKSKVKVKSPRIKLERNLTLLYKGKVTQSEYKSLSSELGYNEPHTPVITSENWSMIVAVQSSRSITKLKKSSLIVRILSHCIYHFSKRFIYLNKLKDSYVEFKEWRYRVWKKFLEHITPEHVDMYCVVGVAETSVGTLCVFGPFFNKEHAESVRSHKSQSSSLHWTVRKIVQFPFKPQEPLKNVSK